MLSLKLAILLLHLGQTLLEVGRSHLLNFFLLHGGLDVLSGVIVAAHHKLGGHGKLLSGQTERFLSDVVANALNFDNHTSRCNRRYKSFGRTLTFTHSHLGRFLCDGLVGEDSDPDLSLALHVTGNSNTGCLDLAAGDPFGFKSLDAKRSEGQLIATLCVALHATFLLSAKLCFLWL